MCILGYECTYSLVIHINRQANERMARGHMVYRSAHQPVLLILLSVLQLVHTQSEYTGIKNISNSGRIL